MMCKKIWLIMRGKILRNINAKWLGYLNALTRVKKPLSILTEDAISRMLFYLNNEN
jgi:hypothetical protein